MTSLSLLGVVPTWVSSWLTPLWLIGIGALIGLVVLAILWAVALALSRVPAIGQLAENASLRSKAVPILSVLSFFVLLGVTLPQLAGGEGGNDAESTVMAALLLVPLALICGLGLVWLTARRTVAEIPQAIREGFLWPIFILALSFSAFAFVGPAISTQPQERVMRRRGPSRITWGPQSKPCICVIEMAIAFTEPPSMRVERERCQSF